MATQIENTVSEDVQKTFKLLRTGNFYTIVQITKTQAVTIDHSAKVPQSTLKQVYDAGSQYQKLIQAPTGYKAPWQQ